MHPPPLVERVQRQQQWFVPASLRRPTFFGYGDASNSGSAGEVFLWRIPMGVHPSPADSLSRWRTGGDEEFLRRLPRDLVSRLQSAELEETEEMEPLEYVD
jgi:hypothetical protein